MRVTIRSLPRWVLCGIVGVALSTSAALAVSPAIRCEKAAGSGLAGCVKRVSSQHRRCLNGVNIVCSPDHPKIVRELDRMAARVTAKCGDDATVQAAGFAALTLPALVERLTASCLTETDSLVARAYAGPHAPTWQLAPSENRRCMEGAFKSGTQLLFGGARAQSRCVDRQRKGGSCSVTKTQAKIARLEAKAAKRIDSACREVALRDVIQLTPATYLERVRSQSECVTAIAHPDTTPLDLSCGPRPAIIAPPRGEYVRIVLDEAEWGTRCGTGSSYAFWIRLAPDGFPVENIVLQMQGGGVCVFEDDCNGVSAGLFSATDNNPSQGGIMSNSTNVSPFANWTKVYLPYCTQDLFIGGGATNVFPSMTVYRWGAINTRVTLRYLRDILWRELDADAEGCRADRIKMLFGGTSAGGFGALYNYHYVLDDLQWIHTSAWPDSALALDNGELFGLRSLGLFFFSETNPIRWDSRAYMPPYCSSINCATGPVLYAKSAERLKQEPEQQFLVLSNQVDGTQVSSTFFSSTAKWINTHRQSYCDTAGTVGVRYFLPANTGSQHVIATKTNLFTGQSVDGILMRDWLELAMADGDSLSDAVTEGSLATAISGVDAFPCAVD